MEHRHHMAVKAYRHPNHIVHIQFETFWRRQKVCDTHSSHQVMAWRRVKWWSAYQTQLLTLRRLEEMAKDICFWSLVGYVQLGRCCNCYPICPVPEIEILYAGVSSKFHFSLCNVKFSLFPNYFFCPGAPRWSLSPKCSSSEPDNEPSICHVSLRIDLKNSWVCSLFYSAYAVSSISTCL